MSKKTKSYPFTLKNINIPLIEKRYELVHDDLENNNKPKNTTDIKDIVKPTIETISFYNEAKKDHKCNVVMIDYKTHKEISNTHNCFWCRNKIPNSYFPIGCPIHFIHSEVNKTYYSEISKDIYSITEQILSSYDKKDEKLVLKDNRYYITDGIFCSFNCTLSFIYENKNKPIYSQSEILLYKIYDDIYSLSTTIIEKAPSYRLLTDYGGYLDIDTFRENFTKITYVDHGTTTNFPIFKSIATLYEENLKF